MSLGTDSAGNLTDPRSLQGTLTFDGNGKFSFTGQQVIGPNAATAQSGAGGYSVDPAGFVSMDSPVRPGDIENVRLGPEGLLGASTDSADSTFDLFAAVPAPATGSSAAFSGSYWVVSLEFPGGVTANARNSIFSLAPAAGGTLASFSVNGHAANLDGGAPATQQVTGGTFTLNADGTGTLSFGAASTASLLSGARNLYMSADGNVILGGSTASGSHDFLIGVKAIAGATNASWNVTGGQSFGAGGLRSSPGSGSPALAYAGSLSAGGAGSVTWSKRMKVLGQANLDFTAVNSYALNADGSGALPSALQLMALGAGGNAFVTSAIDAHDPGAFEIGFGLRMPKMSGSGVFLNPQGVVNAASFAPAGNPVAPGEFIALFGSGMAKSLQTAKPPYPTAGLNGVTVLIDSQPAPVYFVSPGQINCIVPYGTAGPTATIVVNNGGTNSNTVTVPVAATAPGMFAVNQGGSGAGAIRHADFTLVSSTSPAVGGETVLLYLTGMGAVDPPLADGSGGVSGVLNNATAPVTVLVGGYPGTVIFSGLAPGFPGLYQINVTLPPLPPGASGSLPLAISTNNAYHDQVTIPIP
ncbi:MAG TPA: IPT/TIG domain-containing protein [Candidatus Sulfopaludibacter sp.]|nr:IPT/TIG domain-containing protein [Candidatus Sulfopaludibacter sp.]